MSLMLPQSVLLESNAWLTCITIQSKRAPYKHLAIASRVAIASGILPTTDTS